MNNHNLWLKAVGEHNKGEYFEAEEMAKKEKKGIWKGKFDRPEKWRRKYK